MKIGSKEEYLELEELERNPVGTPCAGDVNIGVALTLQGFSGSYDGVWLEHDEIERFITELEILDNKGNGFAKISSMSPEEFTLEIRSSDSLGHMEIEVKLHRHQYSDPKYWPIYLSGGFEAHPEYIRQLILCFKELVN
ncbi:WapI family immunity protein [Teredinibacter turnerae]|uniref:WapI family immunity protein n=1 Tax=Teredinibacter turnerae TaxID=2426 RepID=UPI0030CF1D24